MLERQDLGYQPELLNFLIISNFANGSRCEWDYMSRPSASNSVKMKRLSLLSPVQ